MKNSLRIPRIIHQTWKTKDVPSPLDQLPQTWKEYLPNWEYILWTDEMNREFVCKHFPDFLEKYDTYPCTYKSRRYTLSSLESLWRIVRRHGFRVPRKY